MGYLPTKHYSVRADSTNLLSLKAYKKQHHWNKIKALKSHKWPWEISPFYMTIDTELYTTYLMLSQYLTNVIFHK